MMHVAPEPSCQPNKKQHIWYLEQAVMAKGVESRIILQFFTVFCHHLVRFRGQKYLYTFRKHEYSGLGIEDTYCSLHSTAVMGLKQ